VKAWPFAGWRQTDRFHCSPRAVRVALARPGQARVELVRPGFSFSLRLSPDFPSWSSDRPILLPSLKKGSWFSLALLGAKRNPSVSVLSCRTETDPSLSFFVACVCTAPTVGASQWSVEFIDCWGTGAGARGRRRWQRLRRPSPTSCSRTRPRSSWPASPSASPARRHGVRALSQLDSEFSFCFWFRCSIVLYACPLVLVFLPVHSSLSVVK
jgi:hypothetical protein